MLCLCCFFWDFVEVGNEFGEVVEFVFFYCGDWLGWFFFSDLELIGEIEIGFLLIFVVGVFCG